MRLEYLFDKTGYFVQKDGAHEHHSALLHLFEVFDVASRSDLKLDLIQELERQRIALLAFRDNPNISEAALTGALDEIAEASSALLGMSGRIGQHLRDDEWLMAVKGRSAIPGGVCGFDTPSYYHWLHRSCDERREALKDWIRPLYCLRDAVDIVLRLLRSSGHFDTYEAPAGAYQLMLSGVQTQMVRIVLPFEEGVTPEVSANKYALNIRFSNVEPRVVKPRCCERDIKFEMAFCNL